MNFFTSRKVTPMTESGIAIMRQALGARNRKMNLAGMARDLGVASTSLEAFATGDAKLAPGVLVKLAERIWNGHLKYDVATDAMQSANTRKAVPVDTDCVWIK